MFAGNSKSPAMSNIALRSDSVVKSRVIVASPVTARLASGCVAAALLVAMVVSSLVGTVVPMFFHKIKVDPAVASGPLITTVNDLVAVITYYGLAWAFLINIVHIAG